MNFKEYFDIELRSNLINAVIGAIVGYLSFIVNQAGMNIIMMIVALGITAFAIKKLWKLSKDYKWWISNGVIMFIFMWFIVWTIFYNLQLYSTLP